MHTRSLALVAVALTGVWALAGCGGGSAEQSAVPSTSAPSASAPATSAAADGFTAYRDCMAAEGVDLPDMGARPSAPPSGQPAGEPPAGQPPTDGAGAPGEPPMPDGVDEETFEAAQAACADLAPQPGAGGGAGPGPDVDASALAAFTTCLTDNGVEMAEGTDPLRELDRTDAGVQAAWDACSPLLPQPS